MYWESPWTREKGEGHPHRLLIADIDQKRHAAMEWAEDHERKAVAYRQREAEHQHAMDALIASWPEKAS